MNGPQSGLQCGSNILGSWCRHSLSADREAEASQVQAFATWKLCLFWARRCQVGGSGRSAGSGSCQSGLANFVGRKHLLAAPKAGPTSGTCGSFERLLLCGGRELGIRQGGSGEYRRPPKARGHSAKPTLTPSLDSFPLQTEPPLLEAEFGRRRLGLYRNLQPRCLLSANDLGFSIPLPRGTHPTYHLRPRRLQTRRQAYVVPRSSSPPNTAFCLLHPACS